MAKKATIYKLPGRFPVVMGNSIVAYGRTPHQARVLAEAHGAGETEELTCSEFSERFTSSAPSTRRGKQAKPSNSRRSAKKSAPQPVAPVGPQSSSTSSEDAS